MEKVEFGKYMFVSISQPSSSSKYYENENVFDIINEINMNSTMYERMNEGCFVPFRK
jgi:hypothetical protein